MTDRDELEKLRSDFDALYRIVKEINRAVGGHDEDDYHTLPQTVTRLRVTQANEYADAKRLIDWIRNPSRKPAVTSFTAGPERQVAYAVEDVIRDETEGLRAALEEIKNCWWEGDGGSAFIQCRRMREKARQALEGK